MSANYQLCVKVKSEFLPICKKGVRYLRDFRSLYFTDTAEQTQKEEDEVKPQGTTWERSRKCPLETMLWTRRMRGDYK